MIWFPTVIMIASFAFIWVKLRKSYKAFPYLSIQSKVARSRKKVIMMLLILLVVEIVCWAPWYISIIYEFHKWEKISVPGNPKPDVSCVIFPTISSY